MRYTPSHIARALWYRIADKPEIMKLRAKFGILPPTEIRPSNQAATISDLFIWRSDDTWETQFSLFNQVTHMFPEKSASDTVSIFIFNNKGDQITRSEVTLSPHERQLIYISDLLPEACVDTLGTIAFFHDSTECRDELIAQRTHLTERGYIAYKRKHEVIWNYSHGNLQALSKSPNTHKLGFVAGRLTKSSTYKAQLRFDDCKQFELAYTNPSPTSQKLSINFLDRNDDTIKQESFLVQSRGVIVIAQDNQDHSIVTVQNKGKLNMWRPTIFKYQENTFDVFHG